MSVGRSSSRVVLFTLAACLAGWPAAAMAQTPQKPAGNQTPAAPSGDKVPARPASPQKQTPPELPKGVDLPAGYVIGVEDVLTVFFWREKDISGDAQVRPDGMISLPLLNDIRAAGLTPDQLRVAVTAAATKILEDPTVTVIVKAINSRKVYIVGNIPKPGPYPLLVPTTVLQLIAMAGGVQEFADSENITILRMENGKQTTFRFNYEDMERRRNLQQNIELKPGDTIIVP